MKNKFEKGNWLIDNSFGDIWEVRDYFEYNSTAWVTMHKMYDGLTKTIPTYHVGMFREITLLDNYRVANNAKILFKR